MVGRIIGFWIGAKIWTALRTTHSHGSLDFGNLVSGPETQNSLGNGTKGIRFHSTKGFH